MCDAVKKVVHMPQISEFFIERKNITIGFPQIPVGVQGEAVWVKNAVPADTIYVARKATLFPPFAENWALNLEVYEANQIELLLKYQGRYILGGINEASSVGTASEIGQPFNSNSPIVIELNSVLLPGNEVEIGIVNWYSAKVAVHFELVVDIFNRNLLEHFKAVDLQEYCRKIW